MYVHRSASAVRVFAPAKLNLFFEVLAQRADGFHEIETLMVPVSLGDELEFCQTTDGLISLDCRWAYLESGSNGSAYERLPQDERNLAIRAVELLRTRSGSTSGARIRLWKRIPSAAGLGGGSSDAAAALVAANLAWNLRWSRQQLSAVAAEIGSDVPFFLAGGAAVCRGRGEQVEPLAVLPRLAVVIVKPPEGLSTPAVYRACRPAEKPHCVKPLVDALVRGESALGGRLLHNQLEPAAAQLSDWPNRLRSEFARLDCLGHQLSGSGTSYFGVCRNSAQARRVAVRLTARNVGHVFLAHTL